MILRDVTFQQFKDETQQREIICIGFGQLFRDMIVLWKRDILQRIAYVADNKKYNESLAIFGRSYHVIPVEKIRELDLQNKCILITSLYCQSIYRQLKGLLEYFEIDCYIYPLMSLRVEPYRRLQTLSSQQIPKRIHYFWFGRGEMPEENQRCIESWRKFCPDYEIVKWTEDNYDISKCKYMQQAYENKKWGFVTDFARLDILCEHGGIYLDTDVELIRSLDELLYEQAFMGFQRNFWVTTGLGCGCQKGNALFREMRNIYESVDFVRKKDQRTLTCPYYQTTVLLAHGLRCDNTFQRVDGITIFPTDAFDPQGYSNGKISITSHTYSIHHYSESWVDKENREINLDRYRELDSFR